MQPIKHISILCLVVLLFNKPAVAQSDSTYNFNKKNLHALIITESSLYTVTMFGLYNAWYKDYPLGKLHFFNDNNEWLQMDKMGHGITSYYTGRLGYEALKWVCIDEKKSIWYGGTLGLCFLTSIELFDGVSANWGFSPGDMIANTAGTALFVVQQLAWHNQRISLKYSYHETDYAEQRPTILGSNLPQRMLKDYNGQTYWLSANIYSFLNKKDSHFPKWLNLAIGYGADGMITGIAGEEANFNPPLPVYNRYRQYYLSLDVDLTHITTKKRWIKTICNAFGFIKFPMPALEFNTGSSKFKAHYLYF